MKKIINSIMIVTTAALVFYGGAGVTVISYCCDLCRMTEAPVNDACCQTRCDGQDGDEHGCEHSETDGCCSVEHIDFNQSAQDIVKQYFKAAQAVHSLLPNQSNRFLIHEPLAGASRRWTPDKPPLTPPRDYLSLLTVLLI